MERQRQRLRAPMAASWLSSRSTIDVSLCPATKNHIGSVPGKICGEAAVSGPLKYKPNLRVRATGMARRALGGMAFGAFVLALPAASASQAQTAAEQAPPVAAAPSSAPA